MSTSSTTRSILASKTVLTVMFVCIKMSNFQGTTWITRNFFRLSLSFLVKLPLPRSAEQRRPEAPWTWVWWWLGRWQMLKTFRKKEHTVQVYFSAFTGSTQTPMLSFPVSLIRVCVCVCVCVPSFTQLFAILCTVAHQAPLTMKFSR